MTRQTLHIFAVHGGDDTRHTHLTRAQGEAPDLPPLTEWLGVDALDTDRIEIFPLADLEGVTLSDYVSMAFDPVPPPDPTTRARLDALDGSVLLVPADAMDGDPAPGDALTRIATLPLAQPDHVADLPKADVRRPVPEGDADPMSHPRRKGPAPTLILGIAAAILVVILFFVFIA